MLQHIGHIGGGGGGGVRRPGGGGGFAFSKIFDDRPIAEAPEVKILPPIEQVVMGGKRKEEKQEHLTPLSSFLP
jgi:hypothetical protein